MQEIGIESSLLQDILSGEKTIEARLGKQRFLDFKEGDILSIREDTWKDGKIIKSKNNAARIKIDQILYFETFEEMISSLDYTALIPSASSPESALDMYRQFYTAKDEAEYGLVAMLFHTV